MTIVSDEFDEKYPAFSWVASYDLQCTLTEGGATIATVSGGTTSSTDGLGVGSGNELPHKDLGDAIVAGSSGAVSSAAATLFTSGTYTDGVVTRTVGAVPVVRLSLTLASSTTDPVKIVFNSAAQRRAFGYEDDASPTNTIGGSPRTLGGATVFDFCTTLHWNGIFTASAYDRRTEWNDGNRSQRLRSEYEASTFTTVDRGARDTWLVILRDVHERYLTARHAADPLLASTAGTETEDTYSTLDRLVDADIAEADLYLVIDSSTSYQVSLDWRSDPSTETFAQPGAAGRRFWTLRIPAVEV